MDVNVPKRRQIGIFCDVRLKEVLKLQAEKEGKLQRAVLESALRNYFKALGTTTHKGVAI